MSDLKHNLDAAQREYRSVKYDGDLAQRIGLTTPAPRWRLAGGLLATAAMLAWVSLLVLRLQSPTPTPDPAQVQAASIPALSLPSGALSHEGVTLPSAPMSLSFVPAITLDWSRPVSTTQPIKEQPL